MNRVSVELCSRTFAYPNECPCCGEEPDNELPIPLKVSDRTVAEDTATRLLFPYCQQCVDHISVCEAGSMISSVLMLAGIVASLVLALNGTVMQGLLVLGATIAIAAFTTAMFRSRARSHCTPSCASAGKAVIFYGWSGSTNTFAFESATYTARFAEHNATSLVSVDAPLRSLLDSHKIARLQVPTPVVATRVVPPPRSIDEWITHLEQQPIRISRRIALTRALDVVSDEEERKSLVHVVSRAELGMFLARLDGRAMATRRRYLQRAIAEARYDNIPDVLRNALLRELSDRSRKLDVGTDRRHVQL